MATPLPEQDIDDDDMWFLDHLTTEDIILDSKFHDRDIGILKEELERMTRERDSLKLKVNANMTKIYQHKQYPTLVASVAEILELDPEEEGEEHGAITDIGSQRKVKWVVLNLPTQMRVFLPIVATFVCPDELKTGDLVEVNTSSYHMLNVLPSEYDCRVKAMEVVTKPTEEYDDIGGLDNQLEELYEAIVLPITHSTTFHRIGILPPKGVLLYGPPGSGKTLMARACAAETNATFLKLAGTQLLSMDTGDGAKLVRGIFELARENSPCIIFIDEIDVIGMKRRGSELNGDREVERTMLQLLTELDDLGNYSRIKLIAATNRVEVLDPALMQSGRLDRKIEFPNPTEEARRHILLIHSRKMKVHPGVNFEELARSTDDFNGAQLKAVCVEAGMVALRRDATEVNHDDYTEGIIQVQGKKKFSLNYYA